MTEKKPFGALLSGGVQFLRIRDYTSYVRAVCAKQGVRALPAQKAMLNNQAWVYGACRDHILEVVQNERGDPADLDWLRGMPMDLKVGSSRRLGNSN